MGNEPNLAAIPTIYNGVQFRSRLEARWAAFFDLAGWRWEYEPFDLNGYIPDFALFLDNEGYSNTIVEVKPALCYSDFGELPLRKLEQSGLWQNYLLIGATLYLQDDNGRTPSEPRIGWLSPHRKRNAHPDMRDRFAWEYCGFGLCYYCGKMSIKELVNGQTPICCSGIVGAPAWTLHARQYWKQAGNLTQWKGVQNAS